MSEREPIMAAGDNGMASKDRATTQAQTANARRGRSRPPSIRKMPEKRFFIILRNDNPS